VGGDNLHIDVAVRSRASALITSPAATKAYRSAGPVSSMTQIMHVENGASLEWLPQESILFGGSRHRLRSEIHLASHARFSGWEILALGRPLSGDNYDDGDYQQTTALHVDGRPILLERLAWAATDRLLDSAWGLAGHRVTLTWMSYPADQDLLGMMQKHIDLSAAGTAIFSVTLLDDLLVVRGMGDNPWQMRQWLIDAWSAVRRPLIGRAACPPRIWST
jgi:urease accessory protein